MPFLIEDFGLGDQGFLMNNEAYASQYLDHHVALHPRMSHMLMGRQNLAQGGTHPWAAHGCLEGAAGYATDFRQVMGPAHRDADDFDVLFGTTCPRNGFNSRPPARRCNQRLQRWSPAGRVLDVFWPV